MWSCALSDFADAVWSLSLDGRRSHIERPQWTICEDTPEVGLGSVNAQAAGTELVALEPELRCDS